MNGGHIHARTQKLNRRNNRHRLRHKLNTRPTAMTDILCCDSFDNVVNLSSYQLSVDELNIISKGLTFIPYTPFTAHCTNEDLACFIRKLRLRYKYRNIAVTHSHFKHKSKHIPGPTNYKPLEDLINRIQLTLSKIHSTTGRRNLPKSGWSTIKKLKENHDIIINSADKGSCIVVQDREKYVEAGRKHLDDPSTYNRLETDITNTIKQTINIKLTKLFEKGLLKKRIYEFCLPPEEHRTNQMYFLIKLHKTPHAYRPICSCVNSITSNISRLLDHWMKQAVVLLPTYISDTTHFIKTIENKKLEENILLCTIDVTNMYTNIPLDEGNQCALRALRQLKTSKHLTEMPDIPVLSDLLDMVTRNNVFEFNGEFYIQTRGVPMGNILAPSYSGIFMGELEQKLIRTDSDKIKLWVRYIDDIFMAWGGTNTEFETFLSKCNDAHPTMKFTGECSSEETHFLDTTIYKGTNFRTTQTLDIKTYTKPTNKQAYVHGSSFHPKGVVKSITLGETYRFLRTNTDEANFNEQTHKLEQALRVRGYNENIVKPLIKQIHFKDRHKIIYRKKKEQTNPPPSTPFLSLTYNGHIPEVRKTLRQIWDDVKKDPILNHLFPETPRIALRKNRSLSNLLVRAKLQKQTPRPFPKLTQRPNYYDICRVPTNYPQNLYAKIT